MDMELTLIGRILWRWKWLILICMLTTCAAVWLGVSNTVPVYRSAAVLQFSTPDRQDVELVEQYSFVSSRDEIVQSMNNFVEAAQQTSVYEQTRDALGLDESIPDYQLEIRAAIDADYVELAVENESPILAERIVNTHTDFAIQHYGDLRAQSTQQTREILERELASTEEELRSSEEEFKRFRAVNGITFLETEINLHENMLVELQAEQSRLIGRDPVGQSPQIVQMEARIASHRASLEALAQLEPEYIRLQATVDEVRDKYQLLMSKITEADLKQELARQTSFIQIAAPAVIPIEPEDKTTRLILLALVGSLGFGVLLAFALEYSSGSQLAQEYKIAQEVRSILSNEQLIGTRSLVKQIHERSSAHGDSFKIDPPDENGLFGSEREIEIHRRDPVAK